MLAKELISDIIPAISTNDTGMEALNWMEIFRVSHLPIVNNKEFLGLISDTDIYDLNLADDPIGKHNLSLFSPYILENQHVYEAIELVSRLKLTVAPVLDVNKHYLGLITTSDLIKCFADLTAVNNPGGIIVLELNQNDYSLTQIAQIVESNDAKILSLYINSPKDSMRLEVTLKVNRTDLYGIIQTFERFNYEIKAQFMEDDEMDSLYSSRYESFMKYLSI
ncbi:MAG: CBS domain-containing protein [Bacteroidales bacterium]|nr:CBS domain-containing protein [Bacteroidales bacterium]